VATTAGREVAVADERDATACPVCGSPAWRHRSDAGDQRYTPRLERPGGDAVGSEAGCADARDDASSVHERVAALEQAVQKLRSALIGVAERQDEHDSLPCYCVGERGEGHQEWCVDARAALATSVGKRLGRLRRADELWAALRLPGFGSPDLAGNQAGATPSVSQPPPPAPRPFPDDPDTVLEQVKEKLPSGDTGASGDRVACERCGGVHPLEAKNTLLWYQCADGSFYLGGVDGRLLLPRAPGPEASS